MKISLILILCLGVTQAVFADDSAKVPVKEGYGTLDMKQMGPPGDLPQAKKPNAVTTKIGCLDMTGKTLSQGDPGFETCLMNRTPKNPGDTPTNMNIQFGQ